MKKLLLAILLAGLPVTAFAQRVVQNEYTGLVQGGSRCNGINNRGITYHEVAFTTREQPSVVLVTVTAAPDDETFASVGTSAATTSGTISFSGVYTRVCTTVTTLTGAGATIDATYSGFLTGGTSVGGGDIDDILIDTERIALAVEDTAAVAVSESAFTLKRYISAGSTEDESEVKSTAGVLKSISAWNVSTSNKAMLKCTNLTAANTTPGSSTVFYSMLIPASAGFVESHINATFSVALTCYIVLGAADTAVDEVAANEVGYNLRYE